MQTDKNKLIKIILAFAAVYIIWGTTYLAIRVALESIPPFLMAGTRFFIAGIITYSLLRLRGVPAPQRKQWPAALFVGALMVGGGSGLVHWVEQYIPTGITALVIATIPLWIAFFDWIFFKRIRPAKREFAGLLLGFVGIILLLGPGQFSETAAFSWIGILALLLAPFFWSFGSLFGRDADMPKNSFMASGMEMISGGFILLIVGALTGETQQLDIGAVTPTAWLAFLYLLIFGSMIGYSSYIFLLNNVSAAKASTYSYVNPVIAVYLGWLILSEPISPTTIVAMVVIVIAVFLITSSKTPQPEAEKPMESELNVSDKEAA